MFVCAIYDAAREAIGFAQGSCRRDLDADRMLGLALVRLLEIIGEAARGVSQEFREAHSNVAWKKMAGMRDRLIHGYFDINLDVVWETATVDLPPLIVELEKVIASRNS